MIANVDRREALAASPRELDSAARTFLGETAMPLAFVLLYGSGFVGARYGLPFCPPLTFLALRFGIAAACLAAIAVAARVPWPRPRQAGHIAAAGLLTQSVSSAGVFVAIAWGVSPALAALVIALQPMLVALVARRVVGERVSVRQWCGLALGFAGVAAVLGGNLRWDGASAWGVALSVLALFGLTVGNLYQKRYCADMNTWSGGVIQSGASTLAMCVLAVLFERPTIQWNGTFVAALLYMSWGVSIGALTLLYAMIRRGEVSKVASVYYLVPLPPALAGACLLGETFESSVVLGAATIAAGVWLAKGRTGRPAAVGAATGADTGAGPTTLDLADAHWERGIPWESHGSQGRQGALIHKLYECGAPARKVALVRFTPGSSARAHVHSSYETIYVLAGSYHDDFGEHTRGHLVVYPPNSRHRWQSPAGAALLVVWDAPTRESPAIRSRSEEELGGSHADQG